MEKFKITREMLEVARPYMPLAEKIEYAKDIAERCLSQVDTAETNKEGEKIAAFPNLYREDAFLKAVLLQNVLLGYYFDIDVKIEDDVLASYDKYASCNIIGNILRWKTDVELREKCYDVLDDYHEFERLVNAEIKERKTVLNDALARFAAMIALGATPEAVQKAIEELNKLEGDKK